MNTVNQNPTTPNRAIYALLWKSLFLIFSFVFTLQTQIIAEGTKQIMPNAGNPAYFVLDNGWSQFALYNCPATSRLYISVCNPGEKMYFGFRQNNNDVRFRIMDPFGTQVYPATGDLPVPTAGAGFISTYAQAIAGPQQIVGAAGYDAQSFTPASGPGDYYIEFTDRGSRRDFTYFDITVASAANVAIPGRVWSQAWMCNSTNYTNPFKGKFYIYADDGIVTSIEFNDIKPYVFVISANPSGTQNTAVPNIDRRSRAGNVTYPQYKIFLNNPDEGCFPTGAFGSLTAPTVIAGCGLDRCINISVDQPGNIYVLLDFNGVPGYQPGTSDRQISATVAPGLNCIPWDGLDGLGNTIPNGTTIHLQIDYLNGMTHLPLFDVENHPNGYIVNLVRPAGPIPQLFWDDSQIPGGTTNLAGCTGTTVPNGCHRWLPRCAAGCDGYIGTGPGLCSNTAPDGSTATPCGGWGNNQTINTWWYANIIRENVDFTSATISVDANTNTPGSGAAANAINSCSNATTVTMAGRVTGATGGQWSTTGTGTFNNPSLMNAVYTPSASDVTSGPIFLILTSTGNGACPAVPDSIRLNFTPGPTANAGPDQTKCANNATATLAGSFTVATGVQWTGGAGTFVPNNTRPNATYAPTAGEITAGSVTLTMTTTGNGLCPIATDQVVINYTPAPTVNANVDQTVCSSNAVVTLAGSVTNAPTSTAWTAAAGTFSNAASLTSTFTPSAAQISAAPTSVTLTLTANKSGCLPVTDQMLVNITPPPTINAGNDMVLCKNDSLHLAGSFTAPATAARWTSSGTGVFRPNNTSPTSYYIPSAADKNGTVTITYTTTAQGSCTPVSDQMILSFSASPSVNAGTSTTVCANKQTVTLSGTSSTGSGVWRSLSVSAGTFSPNANSLNAQYTASATEIASGIFFLELTSTANGACPGAKDTVDIFITPAPTVNAGPDQTSCENNATVALTGASVNLATSMAWTTSGTGTFSNASIINPTYTPSANDINAGTVTLTLTGLTSGNFCNPVTDTKVITITPKPTVDAGPTQNTCANNPPAVLNGSFTVAGGVHWTTPGDGTFANSNIPNASYTPGPNDIAAGVVQLTITTTNNGTCNPVSDQTTVNILPAPTVQAIADFSVCANNNTMNLDGNITHATGGQWTTSDGTGSFVPNANKKQTTYLPSAADITRGSVNFRLTSTGVGICLPVFDDLAVLITPSPSVISLPPAFTVCADNPNVTLNVGVLGAAGGIWSGGGGTFSGGNTNPNTTYTPSVTEITAGTVTLTFTTTGNGICNPVSASTTITITPAPTVNAGADQIVCGAATTVNLSATKTNATGVQWVSSGTGTFSSSTSLTPTYTPSAADRTAGSVILTITTTGNGLCTAVSDQMRIAFTPVPTINAGPDQTVCTNDFPVRLAGSGSPANWTGGTGTFSPSASTLNATYTPSAAEATAGTVTLTLTTVASGACPPVSDQIRITIPQGPIANAGPDQTICGNTTTVPLSGASITNAPGAFWTTSGTGTFTASPSVVNPNYVPSAADKTAGSVVLTMTTTGTTGVCSSMSDQVTLTFAPTVTISAGPDLSVCANNSLVTVTATLSNATGLTWSSTTGGTFANPTALSTTYTPSAAEISATTFTLTATSNPTANCPAFSDNMVVTVTPAPTVTANIDQSVCADAATVSLAGSFTVAAGATWTSTGSGTFSPSATSATAQYIPSAADLTGLPKTLTLTLSTTGNGACLAVTDQMIITITPKPTISAGTDQAVCANNPVVTLTGTFSVSTGVQWTSSGTGTFSNNTSATSTYTPSTADLTAGVVTLTITSTGNGTCQPVTDQMIITVGPSPTVSAGFDLIICANGTASLAGTATNSTTVAWTGGTGTFANSASATTTYTPSASEIAAAPTNFNLTLSASRAGCITVTDVMNLKLDPVPTISAGPDQSICADHFGVTLAGTFTGATGGIWSGGTGTYAPSTITANAAYTLSPAERTGTTVTLTFTSTGNGACNAVSDQMNIVVSPAPTINAGVDKTVCANNSLTSVTATFANAGGVTWTTSGTGTFSAATSLTTNYTPSAFDLTAGSVSLTVTTTGNGLCNPVSDQMILTITPAPTLNVGPDQTICADLLGTNITPVLTVATGLQWSTSGTGVFGASSTTTNPTYFPSAADKTAGTVTISAVTTGNGLCTAVNDNLVITITPAPTVTAGADQSACADENSITLAGSFTVAGGVQWTTSGSGTFTPNSTTAGASYTPSNADTTAHSVTLTITTTSNGTCQAVTDQMVINLQPVPVVNAGNDQSLCADVEFISLRGLVANATGGQWSTNGSGTFSPNSTTLNTLYIPAASDLSAGNVTLTLSSTGNGLCPARTDNVAITLIAPPTLNAGSDIQVCTGAGPISINANVTNASAINWFTDNGTGTFSPANAASTVYTPTAADEVTNNISLIVNVVGNGSCNPLSDTIHVNFSPLPAINAGPDATVCNSDFPVILNGSGSVGSWSGGAGTYAPSANVLNAQYTPTAGEVTAGFVVLTLTTPATSVCPSNSDNVRITLLPGPVINAGADINSCTNVPSVTLTGTTNNVSSGVIWTTSGNGTFSNNTSTTGTYSPSAADYSAGLVTLTLTSTGNGFCNPASDQMQIIIQPSPTLTSTLATSVCADATTLQLNSSQIRATGVHWTITSGSGTLNNANINNPVYTFGPADAASGTVTLEVSTTGNGFCNAVTNTIPVTITPKPTVTAGANQTVCGDTTSVPLNGNFSIATGVQWTGGTGSFSPSAFTRNPHYTPSSADTLAGSVTLTLSTTGNGTCHVYSANVTITFNDPHRVDISTPRPIICTGETPILSASFANTSGVTWSSTGTGSFNATSGSPVTYTPSATDVTNGGFTIIALSNANLPCRQVRDIFPMSINPAPQIIVNAGSDQTVCADIGAIQINGFVLHAQGGQWTTGGTGTFNPASNLLFTSYVPSAADISANAVLLSLTSVGNGNCFSVTDTMQVNITPAPTVTAGSDQIVCADTMGIKLTPTITVATGGAWTSTGNGTFAPNAHTANSIYVLSPTDITTGSVGLTISTTGNGTCRTYDDGIIVTITPRPTVSAGSDFAICANATSFDINAAVTVASNATWTSSGSGIFNPDDINATYYLGAGDHTLAALNFTVTTLNQGSCKPVSDNVIITIQPVPVVNASLDQEICADANSFALNGSVTVATGGIWTSSGDGSFSPTATGLNTSYIPSVTDKNNGTVTLTLTSTGNGACLASVDDLVLTITPVPVSDPGVPVICVFTAGAPLNGQVTDPYGNAGTGIWSSSGSGTFGPNSSTLNGVYVPSANDITAGFVNLTLTTTSNATCNPVSKTVVLNIIPAPPANAGADQYVCTNSNAVLSAQVLNNVSYAWAPVGGAVFSNQPATQVPVSTPTDFVLTITDSRGCLSRDTITIYVFDLPTLNMGPLTCWADPLIIDADPQNLPIVPGVFQWFHDFEIMEGENASILTTQSTGDFSIVWAYGNCFTMATTNVPVVPAFESLDKTICAGASTTIAITDTAGNAVTGTYAWSLNGTPFGGNSNTQTVTPAVAGADTTLYNVSINYTASCFYQDSVYVISLPRPIMNIPDSSTCAGQSVLMHAYPTNVPNLNSYSPVTFSWTLNSSLIAGATDSLYTATSPVNYSTAVVQNYMVTLTVGECISTDNAVITFNPRPAITLSDRIVACNEVDLLHIAATGPAGSSYLWHNNLGYNISDPTNDTLTLVPDPNAVNVYPEGYYYVDVTNSFNCAATDSVMITIHCRPTFYIPTGFRPDDPNNPGDHYFPVFGRHFTNYRMKIFNRWGEIIFESTDRNVMWDGTYRGEPMPAGVYPVLVTWEGDSEEYKGPYSYKGEITLIR